MNKRITAAIAALALGLGGVVTMSTMASATTEVCVPSEGVAAYDETVIDTPAYDETVVDAAAHWQRYSYQGSWDSNDAPPFPDAHWQANVQGDPHGIGVAGAYFVSHGNSGNVDWFYLEWVPEQSHVVHHDEVSHVVHHDAIPPVTCDPENDPVLQIGGYCYDKLNPDLPAAWDNSGKQTFAAEKEGTEDWTTAEKFALCNLPVESCEPVSMGFQSDWVSTEDGYTFPEHIQYPDDNIGWPPIYNAVHTDLTQTLAEDCETPVTVVPGIPTPKDLCGVANDHYGLLADTADIAYTRDGLDIVATITSDAVFGALPTGWVDNGDGTATYPFSATEWTHVDCPLPDPFDTFGEWVDGEYGCGDTTVEQTRTVERTTYSNNEDGSVQETVTEGSESQTRDLTAEEIAALNCPTTTPTPPTGRLPLTGDNAGVVGPIAGGVLLAGIILTVGAGMIRRRRTA